MECSLCSLISLLLRFISNAISMALDYSAVVFLLSVFITILFVANILSAKLICDFKRIGNNIGNIASAAVAVNFNGTDAAPVHHVESCVAKHFDYGSERGPHTWACAGDNQSPINILTEYAQKMPIRELLRWNHYDDLPSSIIMENNGHTVIIKANFEGNTPTLSGADLFASYTFVEICFRWSAINNEGSEHMIDHRKFPLELQAMHKTGPIGDTTSSYDLLMLSYFFEISADNPYLDPIIENLHRIRSPRSKIEIPPFPLAYLCHQFRSEFYSYGGSLTEPPCYQGAEWFIFPEPLAIGERQLNQFRQLLRDDGKTNIVRNARPVQNLTPCRIVRLNQYNLINPNPSFLSTESTDQSLSTQESIIF